MKISQISVLYGFKYTVVKPVLPRLMIKVRSCLVYDWSMCSCLKPLVTKIDVLCGDMTGPLWNWRNLALIVCKKKSHLKIASCQSHSNVTKENHLIKSAPIVIPVQGHEDQRVNGQKNGDNDEVLNWGTPEGTKWPNWGESVVSSSERDTEKNEQEIREL